MRILRENYIVHSFRELPKEKDISFGYVTVLVSENPIETRDVLYTTEYGWNTVKNSAQLAIHKNEMANTYVGWLERNGREIIPNHEDWFYRIDDLMEEIYMKIADDPQQYESDSEQEYWNNIDELYSALEKARDFAEEIE